MPAPENTHPSLASLPIRSHHTSPGLPNPISQTSEHTRNRSHHTSPSHGEVVIDMSEDLDDQSPCLVAPTPTPSQSGTCNHIPPVPIPSLSGTSGDIFTSHRRPTAHSTSAGVPIIHSGPMTPDNCQLVQPQHPNRPCNKSIHYPTDGDTGDQDTWYYVTVERTIRIFNTW